jgi:hypothetical protein
LQAGGRRFDPDHLQILVLSAGHQIFIARRRLGGLTYCSLKYE